MSSWRKKGTLLLLWCRKENTSRVGSCTNKQADQPTARFAYWLLWLKWKEVAGYFEGHPASARSDSVHGCPEVLDRHFHFKLCARHKSKKGNCSQQEGLTVGIVLDTCRVQALKGWIMRGKIQGTRSGGRCFGWGRAHDSGSYGFLRGWTNVGANLHLKHTCSSSSTSKAMPCSMCCLGLETWERVYVVSQGCASANITDEQKRTCTLRRCCRGQRLGTCYSSVAVKIHTDYVFSGC